jgi:hypothetical protein
MAQAKAGSLDEPLDPRDLVELIYSTTYQPGSRKPHGCISYPVELPSLQGFHSLS